MASSTSLLSQIFPTIVTFLLIAFNRPSHARLNTTEFINQLMQGHNSARKALGVAPLEWEPMLARYARAYSNQRRRDCKLVHSPGAFGENLFWGQGKRWSARDAVASWVAEKQWYHYGNNSCSAGEQCGHYTQVVWRKTKRVGCAQIICDSGDTFITCEYYPPGNYVGEKPY